MKRPNFHIVQRYQYRSWYLSVILFFLAVAGVLYLLRDNVISPCPNNCEGAFIKTIYAKENLSVEEQVLIAGIRTFGLDHLKSLKGLVFKESSLNPYAVNPTSGACGLFQAYPCKKMKCELSDTECQITWGMKYLKARYGTPTNAYKFHLANGWY